MSATIRWGLILGGAVAAMTLVFALAGWHRMVSMAFVFLAVAIAINAVTVVLCLRQRAAVDGWLGQVRNGLIVGLVASAIIFTASWLITSVVFPDYYAEMAEGYRPTFVAMGMSDAEVEKTVAATAATSPVVSAFQGVIGTLGTSLVVAALAGIWLRRRG